MIDGDIIDEAFDIRPRGPWRNVEDQPSPETAMRYLALLDRTQYTTSHGGPCGFELISKSRDVLLLQHWQGVKNIETGELYTAKGRKFYISPHMTDSEFVQTCLLAVKLFEEHEARERFRFDGRSIFGPHISAEAQWMASTYKDARKG